MTSSKLKLLLPTLLALLLFQGCAVETVEVDETSSPKVSEDQTRPIFIKDYLVDQAKTLDEIYDVYSEFYFDYYPEDLDFIGDVELFGYENPKKFFPEISKESEEILKEITTKTINALNMLEINPNSSEYYDQQVLLWHCEDTLNRLEYQDTQYYAYPYFGAQSLVSLLLLDMHEINSTQDAQAYVYRVADAGRYLNEIHARVEAGIEKNIMIPNSSALDLYSELKADLQSIHIYRDKLDKELTRLNVDQDQYVNLMALYDEAESKHLKPAMEKLMNQANDLMKTSPYDRGISQLSNGKDYYQDYIIPHHVGLNLTAEEIHQMGLKEVDRIKIELRDLLADMGYEEDPMTAIRSIQQSSSTYKGNDAFEAYKNTMALIQEQLPSVFYEENIPGSIPEVRFFDYNSYLQPTIDGNRPAYFNIVNGSHFAYAIPALAIHEASPGHHLQISNVLDNPDTKLLRKLLRTTGYTEGWALYAEKMALETGLVVSNDVKVGMLLSELFRAGRLVVDTGLHYYNWSPDEAKDYFRDEIYYANAQFEVSRYMTMPGQALAYKLGEIKILELREKVKSVFGPHFNLKEFHAQVLDDGYLPLSLLEEKIDNYIQDGP